MYSSREERPQTDWSLEYSSESSISVTGSSTGDNQDQEYLPSCQTGDVGQNGRSRGSPRGQSFERDDAVEPQASRHIRFAHEMSYQNPSSSSANSGRSNRMAQPDPEQDWSNDSDEGICSPCNSPGVPEPSDSFEGGYDYLDRGHHQAPMECSRKEFLENQRFFEQERYPFMAESPERDNARPGRQNTASPGQRMPSSPPMGRSPTQLNTGFREDESFVDQRSPTNLRGSSSPRSMPKTRANSASPRMTKTQGSSSPAYKEKSAPREQELTPQEEEILRTHYKTKYLDDRGETPDSRSSKEGGDPNQEQAGDGSGSSVSVSITSEVSISVSSAESAESSLPYPFSPGNILSPIRQYSGDSSDFRTPSPRGYQPSSPSLSTASSWPSPQSDWPSWPSSLEKTRPAQSPPKITVTASTPEKSPRQATDSGFRTPAAQSTPASARGVPGPNQGSLYATPLSALGTPISAWGTPASKPGSCPRSRRSFRQVPSPVFIPESSPDTWGSNSDETESFDSASDGSSEFRQALDELLSEVEEVLESQVSSMMSSFQSAEGEEQGSCPCSSPGKSRTSSPEKGSSRSPGGRPGRGSTRSPGSSPGRGSSRSPGSSPGRSSSRSPGSSPGRGSSRSPGSSPGRGSSRSPGSSPGRSSPRSSGSPQDATSSPKCLLNGTLSEMIEKLKQMMEKEKEGSQAHTAMAGCLKELEDVYNAANATSSTENSPLTGSGSRLGSPSSNSSGASSTRISLESSSSISINLRTSRGQPSPRSSPRRPVEVPREREAPKVAPKAPPQYAPVRSTLTQRGKFVPASKQAGNAAKPAPRAQTGTPECPCSSGQGGLGAVSSDSEPEIVWDSLDQGQPEHFLLSRSNSPEPPRRADNHFQRAKEDYFRMNPDVDGKRPTGLRQFSDEYPKPDIDFDPMVGGPDYSAFFAGDSPPSNSPLLRTRDAERSMLRRGNPICDPPRAPARVKSNRGQTRIPEPQFKTTKRQRPPRKGGNATTITSKTSMKVTMGPKPRQSPDISQAARRAPQAVAWEVPVSPQARAMPISPPARKAVRKAEAWDIPFTPKCRAVPVPPPPPKRSRKGETWDAWDIPITPKQKKRPEREPAADPSNAPSTISITKTTKATFVTPANTGNKARSNAPAKTRNEDAEPDPCSRFRKLLAKIPVGTKKYADAIELLADCIKRNEHRQAGLPPPTPFSSDYSGRFTAPLSAILYDGEPDTYAHREPPTFRAPRRPHTPYTGHVPGQVPRVYCKRLGRPAKKMNVARQLADNFEVVEHVESLCALIAELRNRLCGS